MKTLGFVSHALFVVAGVLITGSALAQTRGVAFDNTATYVGEGRYNWTVFVNADAATLARIRSVQYTLHPSFPNPVRTVTNRQSNFALTANGWGEFTIYAKVNFTDGTTKNYSYRLNLLKAHKTASKTSEKKEAKAAVNVDTVTIRTGNSARSLGSGRWEWSVFVLAPDDVLNQIQYVEYTLHPTFPQPVQRVTERGLESGKGFVLKATGWGTFEIAVKVVFSNGTSRYLKHQLRFG